jgi:HSP20 family protein
MENKKRSFFERLTGSVSMDDEEFEDPKKKLATQTTNKKGSNWIEEEAEEAELAVDVYQTPTEIVIQTMVAGVRPDDLEISITRDMATISGKREESRIIDENNYFAKELYWGKFSRTISLPQEVEPEEVDATERHGLLTIKLQKVDKEKKNTVKVKSL